MVFNSSALFCEITKIVSAANSLQKNKFVIWSRTVEVLNKITCGEGGGVVCLRPQTQNVKLLDSFLDA